MKLQKSLISLALISILGACGGSDSKSTTPTPTPTPTPTLITTTVDGKAIKGTIANAIVTVYKYVDGQAVQLVGEELDNTSVKTEADGSYTVTIKDYDGAIKVELSVGPDTTMICDAPAGCADVAFRAPIALATVDPTLILSAISTVGSANNGTVNINVSALTHLTSALIEAAEGGVNAQSIQQQSSIIANAFNISGSLTELEPTVVDSPSAVANEDDFNELRYGLINSGIMSALFSGASDASNTMSTSLASAVNDLIANDGALLVNQDENIDGFELSLVDVLNGASEAANAAAEAIAADPELADNAEILGQLEQEETNLENQSEFAQANAGDNGRIAPVVEQPTEGNAIAKAKAMVEDIRLFSHLFEVGTDSNSDISGEGEAYVTLIEEAGVMVEAEAASFLLLAEIADAITQLSAMHEMGTLEGTVFSIDEYLSLDGAEGTITFDEETANGGALFSITATSGTEVVNLAIEAVIAENGKDITLNLDGSIESAGAKLALVDGSFAKINLDAAISRTSLEDDTFDGEITSGELELTVTLEQKSSTSVTNPVKFTGLVKTKLMPVSVPSLSIDGSWDDNSQSENYSFTPRTETIILPEMLTLSGGFSSADGNLIKATLTAAIKDLDSYEAPDFKYIGKKVESLATISFSDDKNTIVITESDIVSNQQQTTETRVFTPGSQVGEWSATSSVVAAFPEEHYWGTGIERKIITKRFDSGITEQGVTYTRAYVTGANENSFAAKSVKITPQDFNSDNLTDSYKIDIINTWDGKEYDGSSLTTLVDANGNILTSDGNVHPWDTAWETGFHHSIEQFMMESDYQLIANPLTVSNGAELLAQTITNWWKNERSVTYDGVGVVTSFFSEEDLAVIADGPAGDLNPATYLTKPLLKDVFAINVSADSKTVIAKDATVTRTFNVDYTNQGNFIFDRKVAIDNELEVHDTKTFATVDSGLDVNEVTMHRVNSFDGQTYYRLIRLIPIDDNDDGVTDYLNQAWSSSEFIDDDGVLVDANGVPVTESIFYYADSHENADYGWFIPFNPLTTTNALEAYKGWLVNARGSSLSTYINDIGNIEVTLTEDEINTLAQGMTTTFDAEVTYPADTESLENQDVFLDVNAALSLETTLGDYQVNLMLSGERTALNDGKFDLDMQYKLPNEEAMRKFSVHMKTDKAGRMTANNSEGVLMVLKEPEAGANSNVIGTIVVGAAAEKVADIEDRDSSIVIVYSNGEVETL